MIYLDNAATTFPKPKCVTDEVVRCITTYCGNPGRGSHTLALRASEALFNTREKLSSLFNLKDPSGCVFTLNTTHALNIALKSHVKRGCHILISDMEHNSVLRQVVKLERCGFAEYDVFSTCRGNREGIIRGIKEKIKSNTTILICQISSNICSLSMPVYEIGKLCREKGIFFIADAAQSAGIYDIDIDRMNIDALCVPSHKGLYGPQGAGAVLFRDAEETTNDTIVEGGSGSDSSNPYMPEALPDRFEAGTMPTPAIAGLSAGIDFITKTGICNIRRHEEDLSCRLSSEMLNDKRFKIYGPCNSGIVLFNVVGASPTEVSSKLDEFGICTRAGLHCAPLAHKTLGVSESGAVRVSFGVFNSREDVRSLLDALCRIMK